LQVRRTITNHERFRRQADLSVTGLSRRVPCDHAYTSRIESGLVPASEQYQRRVAELLGVRRDVLFDAETGRAL
jgi:hypothetical protein